VFAFIGEALTILSIVSTAMSRRTTATFVPLITVIYYRILSYYLDDLMTVRTAAVAMKTVSERMM